MKKLTSLLLCIVMLMSLAVTAFASVDEGGNDTAVKCCDHDGDEFNQSICIDG